MAIQNFDQIMAGQKLNQANIVSSNLRLKPTENIVLSNLRQNQTNKNTNQAKNFNTVWL